MHKNLPDTPHDSVAEAAAEHPPLRVLIGVDTFPPDINGAANFASRLAAGLVDRGHSVVVESPAQLGVKPGVYIEHHDGADFPVYRIYSWPWPPHEWLRYVLPWRSQAHAARILDEVKPDVVHIQSHLVVGRGLARQAKKRGIRVVATNHFMPENLLDHTKLPQFLRDTAVRIAWNDAARTYKLVESVTSPSRIAANFLETNAHIPFVHAISCGIEASLYTPDLTPRAENRIVFVGRVDREKNLDVLFRAVALIDPKLDVKVEIVGGGDQTEPLKQLARDLGIFERVHFTGRVSDEALRAALTRGSVFAMPSIAELQSIATLEAMASGLPIVAADAMALPHLVHNGENGYLFTPGDPSDLADKLTAVLSLSKPEYLAMQKASLRYIEPHDINRTLSTFESLYRGETVTEYVTDATLEEQVE